MLRLAAIFTMLVTWSAIMLMPNASWASAAPAPPTAYQIDAYLASKSSPMAGQGAAFVASGGRWQLDPRLLVAIAGAESAFGKITCAPYNAWGWGCPNGPYTFNSWADGIDTVAEGLRTNYLSEGRTTVALINLKYAPIGAANDPTGLNNHWTMNVSRFMIEQGGDPNDVDIDGVAGTLMLGFLSGTATLGDSYGFEELASQKDGSSSDKPALEVAVGNPRSLMVKVRNTGYTAWNPRSVRLRRIDTEQRIVGASYGALTSSDVAPGSEGVFVVQLAAAGLSDGLAHTSWRLEGPAGLFGAQIDRNVAFAVPDFVADDAHVEVTQANGGIAGGDASTVVVRLRNAGSSTWQRDGSDAVFIGVLGSTSTSFAREGWVNARAAARMLEREAAPGETASFAFRVGGSGVALAMRPFRASGWASGDVARVVLGDVPDEQLLAFDKKLKSLS